MQVLGIIPARGGSKGVPMKNLQLLGGKSLLAHAADGALKSRRLSRVLLTTDDERIAKEGRALGLDVPFMRPAALAADDTPMLPVLVHATHALAPAFVPDVVVVLQPTSPFRTASHIDDAVDLLMSSGADSVVSVVEVPHHFNPVSIMSVADGRLTPFIDGPQILRRQDKPRLYARNGPAVLAIRASVLERGSFYGEDCRPLFMSPRDSVDIDNEEDLAYAEFLLQRSQ